MKTIAAIIAGLLLSFMTFVGGLLTSAIYLDVSKPHHRLAGQDATALWTTEPVAVDRNRLSSLRRLPDRVAPNEAQAATVSKVVTSQTPKDATSNAEAVVGDPQPMVDPVTTAAIDPSSSNSSAIDPGQPDPKTSPQIQQNAAHVEWCSHRYRSYQATSNTYRSFSGSRKTCQSPYSNVAAVGQKPDTVRTDVREVAEQPQESADADQAKPQVEEASFENASNDPVLDRVETCLHRYRSYRVEDNSYQPLDGGPRRQCE